MAQELGPLQRKWVEALRSGDYQRAEGFLCDEVDSETHAYCCLGVACVAALGMTTEELVGRECLETVEVSLLKLRGEKGEIATDWLAKWSLADVNDDTGASFAEIADFIESNPETVFTEPA